MAQSTDNGIKPPVSNPREVQDQDRYNEDQVLMGLSSSQVQSKIENHQILIEDKPLFQYYISQTKLTNSLENHLEA